MKYTAHVATGQYEFIEATSDKLDEMINFHNSMSPSKISQGEFKEVATFTGENILYDEVAHKYTTLTGEPMLSGSTYASQFEKPFPKEMIAEKVAKKHEATGLDVIAQWEMSSKLACDYGTAIHYAMEYYFTQHNNGWYKEPKNPLIAEIIKSCPLYGDGRTAYCEAFISDTNKKMVGIVDLLLENSDGTYDMIDWKTSGDIKPSLEKYAWQMNFYRAILEKSDKKINEMYLMNYDTEWQKYEVDAKQLISLKV